MTEDFLKQLDLGRRTEKFVCFIPKLGKYYLVPNTDLANRLMTNGGAPRAFRCAGSFGPQAMAVALPDFEAFTGGRRYGLEVKGKKSFTKTKEGVWLIGRQCEDWGLDSGANWQGIDLVDYFNYCHWEDETGSKLLLLFAEEQSGEVLVGSLQRLGPPRVWLPMRPYDAAQNQYQTKCRNGVSGMAYFLRDRLKTFYQGDANDLPLFKTHPGLLLPTLPAADDDLSEL